MLVKNLSKVSFETEVDYVDYVSKGLPPTKSQVEKVKKMARNALADVSNEELLEEIIDTAYRNNKTNTCVYTGIIGTILTGSIINHIRMKNRYRKLKGLYFEALEWVPDVKFGYLDD